MDADAIREHYKKGPDDVNYVLAEIAAQLAELNETLKTIATNAAGIYDAQTAIANGISFQNNS